jgi:AcrR family transcriptional regulator
MAVKRKKLTPLSQTPEHTVYGCQRKESLYVSKPGPKPRLTIEAIAKAAIAIADAEGLHGVSMQRIASEMNSKPMSLYRYFPTKANLMRLVVDEALGPPESVRAAGSDWRSQLEKWARGISRSYHRHPWALEATNRLRPPGPNELDWIETGLVSLRDQGLKGAEMLDVLMLIVALVRFEAQNSGGSLPRGRASSAKQWQSEIAARLKDDPTCRPMLKSSLAADFLQSRNHDRLEFGINCILDGVAALIRQRRRYRRVDRTRRVKN